MFEKLVENLDKLLELGVPGNDCVVYQNGKEVFRRFKGFSDLENRIPMNGSERYNIYSCSKVMTCTAALQLWEKGAFKLDDHLADYMPEFADMKVLEGENTVRARNAVTIRHLFTMTAGFDYNLVSPSLLKGAAATGGRCPTREMVKYLAEEPLRFHPGEKWMYSLCHDVLAALVEVLSGMEFNSYVTENIFIPSGMKNSSFLPDPEEYDDVCAEYQYTPENTLARLHFEALTPGNKYLPYRLGVDYASGGAGCTSTVEDYMRFLEAWRTGTLIKSSTLDMMAENQLKSLDDYWVPGYGYGLGVRCPIPGGSRSDIGWGGAAGAYLGIDREAGISFYYAQHVRGFTAGNPIRQAIPECIKDGLRHGK